MQISYSSPRAVFAHFRNTGTTTSQSDLASDASYRCSRRKIRKKRQRRLPSTAIAIPGHTVHTHHTHPMLIAPSVTRLLNQSIQSGCFLVLWKVSNIVPIPKTGDKSNPSNYRPISLLSILSKILEKHVARLLTSQIKDKSLISDSQWGFLSGRSTTSALLCVIDTWQRYLDSGTEMCSVFLDLFDTVPHRNLLLVLKFHPTLLKWICSYLTSRVQRVVVNGATSSEVHAVSGVPQGSVLGPLLFINSATDLSFSPETNITLYADDILLYKPIRNSDDFTLLQTDLDNLSDWAARSCLSFNPTKCKFMVVTRKRNPAFPPVVTLGCHTIARVYQYTYLGVTLSADLSWDKHLCTKAKKMLGLLYRSFYPNSSASSLLKLYISLIRPLLEYACQVWNPYLTKNIEKLEKVQRFALRLCVKQWDLDYPSLLFISDLPTLAARRKYFSLCSMFKIVNQLMHFPQDVFVPRTTPFLHSSKHFYCQPFCRTNSHLFPRLLRLEFTASICQILRLYLLLQIFSERPDECISLCQPHVLIHYLLALAICV